MSHHWLMYKKKQFFLFFMLTLSTFNGIIIKQSRDAILWRTIYGMRKCRNWQTSKTKDLVAIAVVWVQVPSSALKKKSSGGNLRIFFSVSKRPCNPRFKVSAPVGAKPGATGPRAPHLSHFLIQRVHPLGWTLLIALFQAWVLATSRLFYYTINVVDKHYQEAPSWNTYLF